MGKGSEAAIGMPCQGGWSIRAPEGAPAVEGVAHLGISLIFDRAVACFGGEPGGVRLSGALQLRSFPRYMCVCACRRRTCALELSLTAILLRPLCRLSGCSRETIQSSSKLTYAPPKNCELLATGTFPKGPKDTRIGYFSCG